ncbi:MAG: IS1634 family transposase [Muribaculaceae bacterium]|nr:IS1634 family transposase [Muribaculaceae bacterium]
MYPRRKRNASGTFSVQAIEKINGRYKVRKSFGASRDESELQRLESKAQQWIDLHEHGPRLPFAYDQDIAIDNFMSSLCNTQVKVHGPELVYGSLYDQMGYGTIEDEMFRHLVVCRLFNPGSKLKTIDYLMRYLHVSVTKHRIYSFIDRLSPAEGSGIKEQVERISYSNTLKALKGKVGVVFYDMTTLYFEAADEDDLRRCGFSKDGKHSNPQIFLGLLVAAGGNPIGYEIFEGNISEGKTLIPMIESLASRFGFDHPTVVADAGLLSKKNLDALEAAHYQYILGARPKNDTDAVKQKILKMQLRDGQVRSFMRQDGRRVVVSMSDKRARKDARNRAEGLRKLEKKLGAGRLTKQNINNRGYNKYLRMEGEVNISIDYGKFEADAAWDGIKAYITNSNLSPRKIVSHYHNLWFIERAFKMNKTDLRIRPIYHRLRNRIEGHICICFTAYTIMLELERRLKKAGLELSLDKAGELTKTIYSITYTLPETREEKTRVLQMTDEQQRLVEIAK